MPSEDTLKLSLADWSAIMSINLQDIGEDPPFMTLYSETWWGYRLHQLDGSYIDVWFRDPWQEWDGEGFELVYKELKNQFGETLDSGDLEEWGWDWLVDQVESDVSKVYEDPPAYGWW